jgi:hypothetical protein
MRRRRKKKRRRRGAVQEALSLAGAWTFLLCR